MSEQSDAKTTMQARMKKWAIWGGVGLALGSVVPVALLVSLARNSDDTTPVAAPTETTEVAEVEEEFVEPEPTETVDTGDMGNFTADYGDAVQTINLTVSTPDGYTADTEIVMHETISSDVSSDMSCAPDWAGSTPDPYVYRSVYFTATATNTTPNGMSWPTGTNIPFGMDDNVIDFDEIWPCSISGEEGALTISEDGSMVTEFAYGVAARVTPNAPEGDWLDIKNPSLVLGSDDEKQCRDQGLEANGSTCEVEIDLGF